ncbi:hypothetical protein KC335_g117 [Hortaea werneckii]|nr:hypothetical protein KC335_g117 [Hortaea werneckii]
MTTATASSAGGAGAGRCRGAELAGGEVGEDGSGRRSRTATTTSSSSPCQPASTPTGRSRGRRRRRDRPARGPELPRPTHHGREHAVVFGAGLAAAGTAFGTVGGRSFLVVGVRVAFPFFGPLQAGYVLEFRIHFAAIFRWSR